jgi:hypothetical protein
MIPVISICIVEKEIVDQGLLGPDPAIIDSPTRTPVDDIINEDIALGVGWTGPDTVLRGIHDGVVRDGTRAPSYSSVDHQSILIPAHQIACNEGPGVPHDINALAPRGMCRIPKVVRDAVPAYRQIRRKL